MKVHKQIVVTLDEIQALVAKAYTAQGLVGPAIKIHTVERYPTLGELETTQHLPIQGDITFILADRPATESEK